MTNETKKAFETINEGFKDLVSSLDFLKEIQPNVTILSALKETINELERNLK